MIFWKYEKKQINPFVWVNFLLVKKKLDRLAAHVQKHTAKSHCTSTLKNDYKRVRWNVSTVVDTNVYRS